MWFLSIFLRKNLSSFIEKMDLFSGTSLFGPFNLEL
jgi:hypothetical protein